MGKVSLCMIVKNEEDTLGRCLESVRDLVDEIVIVDTGSSDRTKEIARTYTDMVFDVPWRDDFSYARNLSFEKAHMPYCMWLDADDILLPGDRKALRAFLAGMNGSEDVVMARYQTGFDEKGNATFFYYRERIVRRCEAFRWEGAVHEAIAPKGKVVYADFSVTHKKLHPSDPMRNLRIFEGLMEEGKKLSSREKFYYARELTYHDRFGEAVPLLESLLDDGSAWVENRIEGCRLLAICHYRLGDEDKALRSYLRSLCFDTPRAEICCDIAKHFFDRARYKEAVFWYELAPTRPYDSQSGAFVQKDCYGFLPYLQLCVCYDKLGNYKKARQYNELAGRCKPGDAAVEYNRAYYSSLSK